MSDMSLKLVGGFIIITVGLLLGMTFLLSVGKDFSMPEARGSQAKAVVNKTSTDLGLMKVTEEKTAEFVIKNEGTGPLKISNMNSSCGCTKGQFIYQGKTSSEFGMHAESGYLGSIAVGEEAQIRVIYRPSQMPVYGPVERSVSVVTNDPLNPKLTFTVAARVE